MTNAEIIASLERSLEEAKTQYFNAITERGMEEALQRADSIARRLRRMGAQQL